MLRRTRVPVCLLAAFAILGVPAASAQAGPIACASAHVEPEPGAVKRTAYQTLCLLNRERQARGLRSLHMNRKLTSAAAAHSRHMVRHDYFAHTTPTGVDFVDRILGHRYAKRSQRWSVGENLAWGTGSLSTPGKTVEAWMNSPGHRANILNRRFRHVGVGIVLGAPGQGGNGATYTTDFGAKG